MACGGGIAKGTGTPLATLYGLFIFLFFLLLTQPYRKTGGEQKKRGKGQNIGDYTYIYP